MNHDVSKLDKDELIKLVMQLTEDNKELKNRLDEAESEIKHLNTLNLSATDDALLQMRDFFEDCGIDLIEISKIKPYTPDAKERTQDLQFVAIFRGDMEYTIPFDNIDRGYGLWIKQSFRYVKSRRRWSHDKACKELFMRGLMCAMQEDRILQRWNESYENMRIISKAQIRQKREQLLLDNWEHLTEDERIEACKQHNVDYQEFANKHFTYVVPNRTTEEQKIISWLAYYLSLHGLTGVHQVIKDAISSGVITSSKINTFTKVASANGFSNAKVWGRGQWDCPSDLKVNVSEYESQLIDEAPGLEDTDDERPF